MLTICSVSSNCLRKNLDRRASYANLLRQFDALHVEDGDGAEHGGSEIGHYMERLTHLVFGGATVGGSGRACPEPATPQRTVAHALGGGVSVVEKLGRAAAPPMSCHD